MQQNSPSDSLPQLALFPVVEPYQSGFLPFDHIHTLYWEESGNQNGIPALFLHGGPGGGASPLFRRFFDPASYRIVMFDQRGSGKSIPAGELRNNTTQLLVNDIEILRNFLGIEQWLIFGSSWGSTLALAYGQAHPNRCSGFVLSSIFLCTQSEIDWFLYGGQVFHPELHAEFVAPIPEDERGDLLQAYIKRLHGDDPAVAQEFARYWHRYEGRRSTLRPAAENEHGDPKASDQLDLCLARLETHYMANLGFFGDDQLIENTYRIRHLPALIVQGRYDMLCPPVSAFRLQNAYPEARVLKVEDAGHSAFEAGTVNALIAATEFFKRRKCFSL